MYKWIFLGTERFAKGSLYIRSFTLYLRETTNSPGGLELLLHSQGLSYNPSEESLTAEADHAEALIRSVWAKGQSFSLPEEFALAPRAAATPAAALVLAALH